MACHTIRPLLVYTFIEALWRMFDPNSTIGWPMGRLRSTAADLIAFIRAPTTIAHMSGQHRRLTEIGWLFLLNCLIVLAIAMVLFPMMAVFGVEMSGGMADLFNLPLPQILLLVVIVGPITEELIFRTWISGQPRLLIIFLAIVAWFAGSYYIPTLAPAGSLQTATIALVAVIAVAMLVGVICFWKSPVPRWYRRIFPLVFWSQALLFGFVHVFNYAGDNPVALLPFVLPQLVGGLIWGYARIQHGWWSSIIMHMAYNLIVTSGLVYVLLTQPTLV